MNALVRISQRSSLALGLALLVGCSTWPHRKQGESVPDPGEVLPEWAFDAPYYFRPPPEAEPRPASEPTDDYPTHYYVREKVFLVDRPGNEVPADRAPRIAVWWTDTDGCIWNRAGFFGLAQTHFAFVGGDDADYELRFVGPGIRESLTEETIPHRIYHLDRMPPAISVWVTPDLPVFEPGQTLNISWIVEDRFLDPRSVRLNICWSWENPDMPEWRRDEPMPIESGDPDELATRLWHPYKKSLDSESVLLYEIPKHITGESFQFQVRAQDRAGNYGAGYSRPLFVGGHTNMLEGVEWAEGEAGEFLTTPTTAGEPEPSDIETQVNEPLPWFEPVPMQGGAPSQHAQAVTPPPQRAPESRGAPEPTPSAPIQPWIEVQLPGEPSEPAPGAEPPPAQPHPPIADQPIEPIDPCPDCPPGSTSGVQKESAQSPKQDARANKLAPVPSTRPAMGPTLRPTTPLSQEQAVRGLRMRPARIQTSQPANRAAQTPVRRHSTGQAGSPLAPATTRPAKLASRLRTIVR